MDDNFPKKPQGIEVKQFNDDHISIELYWFDNDNFCINLFYLIAALFWWTALFLFLFGIITTPPITEDKIKAILFSTPHILVGIYLLYISIPKIINKTFITVNNDAIIVRDRPIPKKSVDLRISNLEEIFYKVKTEKREISDKTRETKTIYYYQIYAKKYNQALGKKLITTNNKEKMLFIQKTLKDYLNIQDDKQEEEFGRVD